MGIVFGFLPFIAFAVLAGFGKLLLGLVAAVVLAVVPMLRSRSAKLLEAGSAVLFAVLALYAALAPVLPRALEVQLAVNSGLAVIVLLSLAVGRPFTLAYAREQVPPAFWDNPLFLATNRRITWAWAAAFLVMAAASLVRLTVPGVPRAAAEAASIAAIVAAIWFTSWYPKRVRARSASASRTAVL